MISVAVREPNAPSLQLSDVTKASKLDRAKVGKTQFSYNKV